MFAMLVLRGSFHPENYLCFTVLLISVAPMMGKKIKSELNNIT